jgi:hypothetical protein
MEMRALLEKPYTEKERMNFIAKYGAGHSPLNCEIRYTDKGIEAWGFTKQEIEEMKANSVNNLSLPKSTVERAIYRVFKKDFDMLLEEMKNNDKIDFVEFKIDLGETIHKRGDKHINILGEHLNLSKEQLDSFFRDGNYEHLSK